MAAGRFARSDSDRSDVRVDPGRRRHYGTFYGLDPLPDDGRPVLVVHGNCQAESLRVLLAGPDRVDGGTAGPSARVDGGAGAGTVNPVRIPPVHELTPDDLPYLDALLARTGILLSQPVRGGYRDLPLGTAELAARLPAGARVLRYPIVRYLGLHPYQAIVRHPSDPAAVPAGVPYHDLRILTAIRDGLPAAAVAEAATAVTADPGPLQAVGEESLAELARREKLCDVGISDVIPSLGAAAVHTLNHPGNTLLIAFARQVQAALGLPATAADPGRVMLGGIRTPLQAPVLAALGLPDPAREHWLVDGIPVPVADVVTAQLAWYAGHPQFVAAGLTRHADRIAQLGL